jgi:Arc/MetJ family transcription regulator
MKLREPLLLSRAQLIGFALVNGVALALVVAFGAFLFYEVNELSKQRSADSRDLIEQNADELARIAALERAPTDAEVAAAAQRALQVCGRTPSCRRHFLLILRRGVVERLTRDLSRQVQRQVEEAISRALSPAEPIPRGGDGSGGGNPPSG